MKPRPIPLHGTQARYARGCRCEPCREAHSIYQRDSYTRNQGAARRAAREARANTSTAWTEQALCAGRNPRIWYPVDDRTYRTEVADSYAYARTICNQCPVLEQCLQYALSTGETNGMWGGATPAERRNLRRQAAG